MKVRNMFGPALAAGLLSLAGASHAQLSFTITQPSVTTPGGTADSFYNGVNSDNSLFSASLIQNNSPQSFNKASSVSFGLTSNIGANGTSDTFTNKAANFTFDLTVPGNTGPFPGTPVPGAATRQFVVMGFINGSSSLDANGVGSSDAAFRPDSFLVDGVNTPFIVGAVSPAGRVSDLVQNLNFGGTHVDVFFDAVDALTTPGNNAPLTIGGYVTPTSVPEPGTVALLTGLGVTGTVFLRRKRANA